mmetsp:Transcript_84460/g.242515  ORF Transcript_84460/g.242515 Transcript_84460/m.242515 type:complete len:221 (+) Transcript_84460:476-1138(+)
MLERLLPAGCRALRCWQEPGPLSQGSHPPADPWSGRRPLLRLALSYGGADLAAGEDLADHEPRLPEPPQRPHVRGPAGAAHGAALRRAEAGEVHPKEAGVQAHELQQLAAVRPRQRQGRRRVLDARQQQRSLRGRREQGGCEGEEQPLGRAPPALCGGPGRRRGDAQGLPEGVGEGPAGPSPGLRVWERRGEGVRVVVERRREVDFQGVAWWPRRDQVKL